MSSSMAFLPYLVSTSKALKSAASAARRSPLVSAPKFWSRLATVEAKRRSPPHAVIMSSYSGPDTWMHETVKSVYVRNGYLKSVLC